MQCPLCLDQPLEPKFVGRTEVDICASCRGIWLDRGELDRLLDAPVAPAPPRREPRPDDRYDRPDDRYGRYDDPYGDRGGRAKKGKKPKSRAKKLADLFDEVLDF